MLVVDGHQDHGITIPKIISNNETGATFVTTAFELLLKQ